jgi:putative secretion ATPase (PEP-CTERM system associated)
MYERFYNLRERPFALSPDPDYVYPSRNHTEALGYLRYGIEGHAGFVVITGDVGSGKTTLLQTMLRAIDRRTSVARLVSTMFDARELIEAVMLDFGLDPQPGRSKPHLLRDLAQFLVHQRRAGRLALLIIDEAQNLSLAALEEVRMLSNLETEKSKLIQIVLVGQPNLQDVLSRPELEQLRQRVTVRYHLRPLDPSETAAYINHRLRKASIGAPIVFSSEVTDLIERSSQGLPRKINVIGDAVLLFGYGEGKKTIDAALVRDVIAELESTGVILPVDAPRAVPAAPVPVAAASTAVDVSVREAHIALRERQLAEQHRILTEQYRIIRRLNSSPQPSVQTAAPVREAAPAPIAQPGAARTPAASTALIATTFRGVPEPKASRAARAAASPSRDGVWTRVRRGLFGSGKPLVEEPAAAGDSLLKRI